MSSKLAILLAVLTLGALGASAVSANEGRIILRGTNLACEGISIWKDFGYKLFGRCQGLVYPYQERFNNYTLWARPDAGGEPDRVDSIEVGYFDGRAEAPFTEIFITAESGFLPREPSANLIVSGNINKFTFAPATGTVPVISPVLPSPTPTPRLTSPAVGLPAVGTVVRRLIIAVVVIFIGILIAVVGFQWITKKNS